MRNVLNLLDDVPAGYVIAGSFCMAVIVGLVDYYTGPEIAFSIFYLLPIAVVSWYTGTLPGVLLSITSALVWVLADIGAGHVYTSGLVPFWNTLMRLGLFIVISLLLAELRRNIKMLYQREMQIQREQTIIQTSQKITALLAENLTQENAEILKWVESQKKQGREVDESLERASKIIGSSLHVLTEASFVTPFTGEAATDVESHMEDLTDRLSRVQETFETYYSDEAET